MYSYCMFMYLHCASWHSSATLTEVFPFPFPSVVRQMPGYNPQRRGTARTLPKIFVLFYVFFVLCRSVYCLCVNVYCTTATECKPNCSWKNIRQIHTYCVITNVESKKMKWWCMTELSTRQICQISSTRSSIVHILRNITQFFFMSPTSLQPFSFSVPQRPRCVPHAT